MSRPMNQDSRLVRDNAQQERDSRSTADAGRVDTSNSNSFEQRMQMMRDSEREEVLPTPPEMPGFRLCWLSTTNSADSIYKRVRQGWQPVLASEVPTFRVDVQKGGEYDGIVSCREMLLYKIPKELGMDRLAYYHGVRPAEEEVAIRAKAAGASHQVSGGDEMRIAEGDSFTQLGVNKTPIFNC